MPSAAAAVEEYTGVPAVCQLVPVLWLLLVVLCLVCARCAPVC